MGNADLGSGSLRPAAIGNRGQDLALFPYVLVQIKDSLALFRKKPSSFYPN